MDTVKSNAPDVVDNSMPEKPSNPQGYSSATIFLRGKPSPIKRISAQSSSHIVSHGIDPSFTSGQSKFPTFDSDDAFGSEEEIFDIRKSEIVSAEACQSFVSDSECFKRNLGDDHENITNSFHNFQSLIYSKLDLSDGDITKEQDERLQVSPILKKNKKKLKTPLASIAEEGPKRESRKPFRFL